MNDLRYQVSGMSCQHCVNAVTEEVTSVPGVEQVQVDLEHQAVAVHGSGLDDAAIRAALTEAGYPAVAG